MATDKFENTCRTMEDPTEDWSNGYHTLSPTELPGILPRAITCHTTGNVDIISANGNRTTITLTAGDRWPCRPVAVDTPTDGVAAAGVVLLY